MMMATFFIVIQHVIHSRARCFATSSSLYGFVAAAGRYTLGFFDIFDFSCDLSFEISISERVRGGTVR